MTSKQFVKQIPADKAAGHTPPDEIDVNSHIFYENSCAPASAANHQVWLNDADVRDTPVEDHVKGEGHPGAGGCGRHRALSAY